GLQPRLQPRQALAGGHHAGGAPVRAQRGRMAAGTARREEEHCNESSACRPGHETYLPGAALCGAFSTAGAFFAEAAFFAAGAFFAAAFFAGGGAFLAPTALDDPWLAGAASLSPR